MLTDQERKANRAAYMREYKARRKNDPAYKAMMAEAQRKWKYGISQEQFDEMLKRQGGCCAACHSDSPGRKNSDWHVDHNHATGEVRGTLCHSCNVALGYLKDSAYRVSALLQYIE